MSPSPQAAAQQRERARLGTATAQAAGKLWRRVDRQDLRESWARLLPELLLIVTGGQLAAARTADPFLQRLLGNTPGAVAGQVQPDALAGVAPDGRDLLSLLMYPVWGMLGALARGASLTVAWASGAAVLDMMVRTIVADTGRSADLVAMICRPAVTSYVRVVDTGACSRCILLAGVEYGISTGFQRHPRCACTMEPVTRLHRPTPTSAATVFAQLTPAQQLKTFGQAAVQAIDAGADIAQVVNARRGMTTATYYGRKVSVTTEGTTRRGIAGGRRSKFQRTDGTRYATAQAPRLMPEEIFRLADGDREPAIRLLKRHAFIV